MQLKRKIAKQHFCSLRRLMVKDVIDINVILLLFFFKADIVSIVMLMLNN